MGGGRAEWISKVCRAGGNPRVLLKWIMSCLIREITTRDEGAAGRGLADLKAKLLRTEVRRGRVCACGQHT